MRVKSRQTAPTARPTEAGKPALTNLAMDFHGIDGDRIPPGGTDTSPAPPRSAPHR